MKNKKLKTLVGSLVLVSAIAVGATLAYFTDNDAATNVITMGHVDVDLDEPNYDPGDDEIFDDVTPGQTIRKDPTITLSQGSESAWVRAKIEYTFDGKPMSDEMVKQLEAGIDITSSWVVGDEGYLYFQEPLVDEEGKNVAVLFNNVTIPAEWGNEVAEKRIEIKVTAEAIQYDNFEPERNELDEVVGWNGVTAETYPLVNN